MIEKLKYNLIKRGKKILKRIIYLETKILSNRKKRRMFKDLFSNNDDL
jgi:hypothetical protein